MVLDVSNPDSTDVIIPRALRAKGVTDGKVQKWPGTDVDLGAESGEETSAAKALIGKDFMFLCILFYVADRPRLT